MGGALVWHSQVLWCTSGTPAFGVQGHPQLYVEFKFKGHENTKAKTQQSSLRRPLSWFGCKISTGPCLWTLDPQLMTLSGRMWGLSETTARLVEVGHGVDIEKNFCLSLLSSSDRPTPRCSGHLEPNPSCCPATKPAEVSRDRELKRTLLVSCFRQTFGHSDLKDNGRM